MPTVLVSIFIMDEGTLITTVALTKGLATDRHRLVFTNSAGCPPSLVDL